MKGWKRKTYLYKFTRQFHYFKKSSGHSMEKKKRKRKGKEKDRKNNERKRQKEQRKKDIKTEKLYGRSDGKRDRKKKY